jgi:alanine racemase
VLNTAMARIDLSALRENLCVVRVLCPHSRIMAMVKANAYGHGLVPVARALDAADGFAVARLEEALELRQAGIDRRILLLSTLLDRADLRLCAQQDIDVTAHSPSSVADIDAVAREWALRVWLELDAGMHRAGLAPHAFIDADRRLCAHPGIVELVHMSHFSSAGSSMTAAMDRQLACFAECHAVNPHAGTSLANSAALITRPETHGTWVRPGIMLYGDNPLGGSRPLPLRAAMTVSAKIIAIRDVEAGETVGYNEAWTSPRESRIATIGIGYGDGYPRHAPSGTPVRVTDRIVPLVGAVSMDSLTVDVSACPGAQIGDEALLWGTELSAARVARHAGTISYELFASLGARVPRTY